MSGSNQTIKSTKDIFTNWQYLRPVLLLVPLVLLRSLTGWAAVQSFSLDIFQSAGGAVDARYMFISQ